MLAERLKKRVLAVCDSALAERAKFWDKSVKAFLDDDASSFCLQRFPLFLQQLRRGSFQVNRLDPSAFCVSSASSRVCFDMSAFLSL